ncbi:MAG TPA: serine/threonine-protein kinase [Nannocystaceae bacterium]|nr:serine/threonine-protein kinase [Nannocystaceae bacterium]
MTAPPDSGDGVGGFGLPTPMPAPAAVRGAIRARVLAQTLGRSAAGARSPRIGGRYRLVREIGRGGMGVVWEAELEPLGKRVAIKLLRRAAVAAPGPAARFLREAIAVSAVGHEHIVRVDDFGTDEHGEPFLVMELLVGRSLAAELAERGPLPWPRARAVLLQLCDALAAAHRHGIVHRDLKPANVFLVERPDSREVHCKLLDFGLCKAAQGGSVPAMVETRVGALLGTPAYMAPEQIEGALVDARTDLYALGCVAYEIVTGNLAFGGVRAEDVLADHLAGKRPDFAAHAAWPAGVIAVIERALARDRGARFADADEMAAALRAIPGPRVRARSSAPRRLRRGVGPWLVAAAGLAAIVGGGVLATLVPVPHVLEAKLTRVARPVTISIGPPQSPSAPVVVPPVATPPPIAAPVADKPIAPARERRRSGRIPAKSTATERPLAPDPRLVDGIRDPFAKSSHE